MKFNIRKAEKADYPFILRVNEENVEVLAPMDEARLDKFMADAEMLMVAEAVGERTDAAGETAASASETAAGAAGTPAAFLIALREGVDWYDSENYRWFCGQYPSFLYVDRIVIDAPFRKQGLGRALYEAVFAQARATGVSVVTAEIDTIPYNEASLAFHEEMGFCEVGEQFVRGGTVKVSLQAADPYGKA